MDLRAILRSRSHPEPCANAELKAGLEPRIGRSVSTEHAAELLEVSRRTMYNRIRDGNLQTIRTLGGSQRVLLDSVQDDRSQAADMPSCGQAR